MAAADSDIVITNEVLQTSTTTVTAA
jgi:hypothetical protein